MEFLWVVFENWIFPEFLFFSQIVLIPFLILYSITNSKVKLFYMYMNSEGMCMINRILLPYGQDTGQGKATFHTLQNIY